MTEYYNNHYIRTRTDGCIVEAWSDGPHNTRTPTEDDILLTDKGGYQFRLFPGGEENPPLYTMDFLPLYKWDGAQVVQRTEEEIQAERDARPTSADTPTQLDRIEAQVVYTALLTDTMLEEG